MKTYKLLDGSWAYVIKDGELHSHIGNIVEGKIYSLIATCEGLPADTAMFSHRSDCRKIKNNVIIQDLDSGEVFFSQSRFLQLHEHHRKCYYCPNCGHKFFLNEDT